MTGKITSGTTSGFKIFIRSETEDEYEKVNKVVYKAFAADYGVNAAADIVERFKEVRKKDAFIPALSLVALLKDGKVEDAKIVGQITLYETDIVTGSGINTQLVLSQCAVLPGYRKRGIMREMAAFALNRAKEMGYKAVFLGGDARLYEKFGFEPSYIVD